MVWVARALVSFLWVLWYGFLVYGGLVGGLALIVSCWFERCVAGFAGFGYIVWVSLD